MKKIFTIYAVIVSLISCSKDSTTDTISNQILSGTVEGKSFTFIGGKAFFRSSTSTEMITIYLTNESLSCESDIFDFELRISADVPNKVGVYTDINIVTADGNGTPFNSLGETVEITAVSATEIKGKMKLNKKASNIGPESIFEGSFKVAICE